MTDTPRRELTPDEQAQVDALVDKLTAPVVPPAPDGFDHWPSLPHGAADVSTPHRAINPKKKWYNPTLGELKEIAAGHKAKADAASAAEAAEAAQKKQLEEEAEAAAEAAEGSTSGGTN